MVLRTQRWNRLTTLRLVHLRSTETGTLRNAAFFQSPYDFFFCVQGFSGLTSDRKMSSYKERLRSGLVDIKKDDAVALFQSMLRSLRSRVSSLQANGTERDCV
ncbi:BnaA09g46690D [Brassica napus]|uniref:BnaA09g46690D protein n=1 Tax=Brassica napus TaxID=3708 RepID=A0A078GPQ1_BRANA|nr:BnaA09g46690D [Brassica napus]